MGRFLVAFVPSTVRPAHAREPPPQCFHRPAVCAGLSASVVQTSSPFGTTEALRPTSAWATEATEEPAPRDLFPFYGATHLHS